jgi:hypothetical protein
MLDLAAKPNGFDPRPLKSAGFGPETLPAGLILQPKPRVLTLNP